MTFEQALDRVGPAIRKVCWSRVRKVPGLEYEDLYQEALMIVQRVVEADEEWYRNDSLPGYIVQAVANRFNDLQRRMFTESRDVTREVTLDTGIPLESPPRHVSDVVLRDAIQSRLTPTEWRVFEYLAHPTYQSEGTTRSKISSVDLGKAFPDIPKYRRQMLLRRVQHVVRQVCQGDS